jgi:YidC/Oxa1 family membrane protein insertase
MSAFFELFANILAWFYSLIPNFAVSIILLTLLVMIIVTPLTLKGTRSMMVMQQLQPEMRKIQQKYKDDRTKQNEELLKFYKENDISPLGGCLPLLVQAPVFIVLYQVLLGLTRRQPNLGFSTGWVSGQLGIGTNPVPEAPNVERAFDPAYVNHNSNLYNDLSNTTQMSAFGLDLSESASQALEQGVVHALPYLALIAIVGVTGFVQQRQIQGRNTGAAINPQQQMIMKIMPVFLPVISFTLPAGLVLYFATSNLFRIGQQAFISRSIYGMSREDQRANRQATKSSTKAAKNGKGDTKAGTSGGDDGSKHAATKADERKPARGAKAEPKTTSNAANARPTAKAKAKPEKNTSNGKASRASNGNGRNQKSGRATGRGGRSGSGGDSAPAPTLQPRARKKKR